MKQQIRIFCSALGLSLWLGTGGLKAQNVSTAAAYYNTFVQQYSNGSEASAYAALYQSYEAYVSVLEASPGSTVETQATSALKNIFPYLEKAAYYFSAQNNQAMTLKYAQAYVGLSMHPAMQRAGLDKSANYTILAKLAAFNTIKSGYYEKAIPYLQAYLSTGDTEMRPEAFYNLGMAYTKQKNYAQARIVFEEGLRQYPKNTGMLMAIVNVAIEGKDDATLQSYLGKAIEAIPSTDKRMPMLLKTQGLLQEKQNHYEDAIKTYSQLKSLLPEDLNTHRHLAQNYFNAGVGYLKLSKEANGKALKNQYKQKSDLFFQQAEPILRNVMASDPLSVNYAFALATVYSCLGETAKLRSINDKIMALGYQPVAETQQTPTLMAMGETVPAAAVLKQPVASQPVTSQPMVAQPMVAQQSTPAVQPQPVAAVSDVDINIPNGMTNNENTFAVIIANEDYAKVAKVALANNDGRVFAEYCQKVLGLPKENVRTHYNATSLEMEDALDDIKRIAAAYNSNLDVIFYYAGHGVPDEKTKDAFLLPIDANGQRTLGCMPLNHLYRELGALNAHSVTVFLDACFSGSQRGDGMLDSVRGVAIKPKDETAKGNMVIFSATTDAQTAMPYEEKQHGLFTYFLLKKLQETRGNVTLGELGHYITEKVSQRAEVVKHKSQTPKIISSMQLGDRWKNMKLIK